MPFIALGVAMIIIDATIIRDLHVAAATAEWVNSIYSLVFAALLITLGRVGDMFGRRRDDPSGDAVYGERAVPRTRAGDRVCDLGLDDRRDGSGGPVSRWPANDRSLMAMGVPDQRPARTADPDRTADRGPGDLGPEHAARD